MLRHTEQVGFTTTRGPLRSRAHGRAEATHISISYTDKLPFSLPGRFPHEWMKRERFGRFADARHTAFQVPTERHGGGVRSSNRQIKNKLVTTETEAGIVIGKCGGVQYVVWAGGDNSVVTLSSFFFNVITNAVKS